MARTFDDYLREALELATAAWRAQTRLTECRGDAYNELSRDEYEKLRTAASKRRHDLLAAYTRAERRKKDKEG
jgi:hypothetical protein